ncbi:hypothetical protein [Sphingomonas sp. LaA6.9]|uniref:hypothetical protein n=1 Tax=Sphingomonas sp. LaA6.9 TaxID=2919914 RepID=UPI001F4F21F0|nr:hypothetical protein [Sphingomonas sp. LaA6.9]MCJ8156537.1 hypothetical protein [Sphingomonas sp. LaA6.9]
METRSTVRHALDDYPLSLQSAARALWGDGFWGRDKPRPVEGRARTLIHRR